MEGRNIGGMRWILLLVLSITGLRADIEELIDVDQTFINEELIGKGVVFEIMIKNLSAIRCVNGYKVYLKSERLMPSDEGLMLVGDDASLVMLPKVYSDQFGCYVKSFIFCARCGFDYPVDTAQVFCPFCGVHCGE